jgi:hypothetical protein
MPGHSHSKNGVVEPAKTAIRVLPFHRFAQASSEPNAISRISWTDGNALSPPAPAIPSKKPRCKSGLFSREGQRPEVDMDAKRFQRAALAKLVTAGSVTAIVACFAFGSARAQLVQPVPPTTPTLNSSSPSTVPQSPEAPVSPGAPSGLSGSGVNSGSSAGVPAIVGPASHEDIAASARVPSNVPSARRSHHGHLAHGRSARNYAVRMTGPSYFPGLGFVYPPYPDPCHWQRAWEVPWMGNWMYTCS